MSHQESPDLPPPTPVLKQMKNELKILYTYHSYNTTLNNVFIW